MLSPVVWPRVCGERRRRHLGLGLGRLGYIYYCSHSQHLPHAFWTRLRRGGGHWPLDDRLLCNAFIFSTIVYFNSVAFRFPFPVSRAPVPRSPGQRVGPVLRCSLPPRRLTLLPDGGDGLSAAGEENQARLRLAAACADGAVYLWEVASGSLLARVAVDPEWQRSGLSPSALGWMDGMVAGHENYFYYYLW